MTGHGACGIHFVRISTLADRSFSVWIEKEIYIPMATMIIEPYMSKVDGRAIIYVSTASGIADLFWGYIVALISSR